MIRNENFLSFKRSFLVPFMTISINLISEEFSSDLNSDRLTEIKCFIIWDFLFWLPALSRLRMCWTSPIFLFKTAVRCRGFQWAATPPPNISLIMKEPLHECNQWKIQKSARTQTSTERLRLLYHSRSTTAKWCSPFGDFTTSKDQKFDCRIAAIKSI